MNASLAPAVPTSAGLPPGHVHDEAPPPGLQGAMVLALVVSSLCLLADAASLGAMVWTYGSLPAFGPLFWGMLGVGLIAPAGLFASATQMLRRSPRAMGWMAVGAVAFGGLTVVQLMGPLVASFAMPSVMTGWSAKEAAILGAVLLVNLAWWATKMGSAVWAYRQTRRPEVAEWIVAAQP